MLKRIQKITNIGRFANCVCPGCEFKKETIIFGFNAQGKSTLTEILKSIQSGNNSILIGRKTFGATGNKYIEIDFDNNGANVKYVFQNKTWNKANPNILIFDSEFISENVFSGELITYDQQRKLNTIIIGSEGQKLNSEIFGLKKLGNELAAEKTKRTLEFTRNFQNYDFDKFKSLPKDNKIDKKINDIEKQIKLELNKESIKKSIASHLRLLSSINFSIKASLSKTLDVKQKEIEEHIRNHFTSTDEAQSFLKKGLSFLKIRSKDGSNRKCVFCGQELNQKAETLIGIYSKFFQGGYEQLQNEINRTIDYFKELNLEVILEKIKNDLSIKGVNIGLDQKQILNLVLLKNQINKELEKKRNLNYSMNFSQFDNFESEIEKLKKNLQIIQSKLIKPSLKSITDLVREKENFEIIKNDTSLIGSIFARN